LWPGYGENVRVLKWMLDRIEGRAAATETPIGFVPTPGSLTLDGLAISRPVVDELLRVDAQDWSAEADATAEFFEIFGDRLPAEIRSENKALQDRLHRTSVTAR
jgi:phosphoenolpyruvate carboxykinase (GTP)